MKANGSTTLTQGWSISAKVVLAGALATIAAAPITTTATAQAPAAVKVSGTVKTIAGNTITVQADGAASATTLTIADGARIQQSADMKTVSATTLDQLAVGDRVLATGTPGDGGVFTANRLILIKSAAIAQRNASSQADWARRGSGGIVKLVDASANTVTISSGKREVTVTVTGSTVFRRYAPGSVKFEDAKPSTLAAIMPGDQFRVRGDKSPDGANITADEIVSGTFKNLSGTVVSINPAANSFVIKDLATKKNETVIVGDGSDLHSMPAEMAARLAGRGAAGARPAGAAPSASGVPAGAPGGGFQGRSGGGRAGDLAGMIPRLPRAIFADLKQGEALMIVASGNGNVGPYTAITLLTGVEALLTGPAASEMSISPWSLGSGGGGEGGAGPE